MRRKENQISESNFWETGRFEYHEHVETREDYDKLFKLGETQVENYLGQLSGPLTFEILEQVHGRLFGEIHGNSGEFKQSFEKPDFLMLRKQEEARPDLSQQEELQWIAEQHIELVDKKAFLYGNEEVANLITEWRMEQVFGERQWQGLDQVDAQNWDRAVERGDAQIVAGFLENQLQDARSHEREIFQEQNPLIEFQISTAQNLDPSLGGDLVSNPSLKEAVEAGAADLEAEKRLADLNAKGEPFRQQLAEKISRQKQEEVQRKLSEEQRHKQQNTQKL